MYTRYFNTTMTGVPDSGTAAGNLTDFLDVCLVNGCGSVTALTLSVSSNVATFVATGAHDLVNYEGVGPVMTIINASNSALNITVRVTVTNSTTFTYPVTLADGTYTGTASASRASLGWSIEYTATNERVYRPPSGTRHRLYVGDNQSNYALVRGRISSLSISDTSDQFPTTSQQANWLWGKATTAEWVLIGNETGFFLRTGNSAFGGLYWFGDYNSFLNNDAYACCIGAKEDTSASYPYTAWNSEPVSSAGGIWIARDHSGSGSPVNCSTLGAAMPKATISAYPIGYAGGLAITGTASGLKVFGPLGLYRNSLTYDVFGTLGGFYQSLIKYDSYSDLSYFAGVSGLANVVLVWLLFWGGSYAASNTHGATAIAITDWS